MAKNRKKKKDPDAAASSSSASSPAASSAASSAATAAAVATTASSSSRPATRADKALAAGNYAAIHHFAKEGDKRAVELEPLTTIDRTQVIVGLIALAVTTTIAIITLHAAMTSGG